MRNTNVGRWAWDVFLVRVTNPVAVANFKLDLINPSTPETILGWLRVAAPY